MIGRKGASWEIILADLALILFLTVLAGFVAARSAGAAREEDAVIADTQAIYRRVGEVSLTDWLEAQQPDSRLQLTIFARYRDGERFDVWAQARVLMREAQEAGYSSRVIMEPADTSDVYAALAYDGPHPGIAAAK